MRQFDPFSDARKIKCVFPDDVAAPERVDPDFIPGSFTGQPFTAMSRCLVVLE